MPFQVTVSHGAVTTTSSGFSGTLRHACDDARERWLSIVSARPDILDRKASPDVTIRVLNVSVSPAILMASAKLRKGHKEVTIDLPDGGPVPDSAAITIANLAYAVRDAEERGMALGGRRPKHWGSPKWPTDGKGKCTWHTPKATRTTRRETSRGVIMVEHCACGARREVRADGWENVYGEWET